MRILKASFAAGAGKTSAAVRKTVRRVSKAKRVLIISANTDLLIQTAEDVRKAFGKPTRKSKGAGRMRDENPHIIVRAIYGRADSHDGLVEEGKVVEQVTEAIMAANGSPYGCCLLITHEAFKRMRDGLCTGWVGLFDEADEVVVEYRTAMAETHAFITDHLKPEGLGAKNVKLEVKWGHKQKLQRVYDNPRNDKSFIPLKEFSGFLLDPNYHVYTSAKQWNDLRAGEASDEQQWVVIKGPGKLAEFEEITVMGAKLEATSNYFFWERMWNVDWQDDAELAEGLRYTYSHPNSHLVEFYGAFNEMATRNSKKQLAFVGSDEKREAVVKRAVLDMFGDSGGKDAGYAWCDNNYTATPLPVVPNEADSDYTNQIHNKPQGKNEVWEGYADVALLGTYNYTKLTGAVLEDLGFTRDMQEVDRNFLYWYQQLMRCAPRRLSYEGITRCITFTTRFGDWCKREGLFPDSTSLMLPATAGKRIEPLKGEGRPREELTSEERASKEAAAKLRKRLADAERYKKKKAGKAH